MNSVEKEIIELLQGSNSIPVKLRNKKNIDLDYIRLIELLDHLIEKYQDRTIIPKDLSYAFLDLSNYFDLSTDLYTIDELEKIEDMGNTIIEKIIEFYES